MTVAARSDHVINAVRISAAEQLLPASSVTARHYRHGPGDAVIAETIALGPRGEPDRRPPGFLDQLDHDLKRLATARRSWPGLPPSLLPPGPA